MIVRGPFTVADVNVSAPAVSEVVIVAPDSVAKPRTATYDEPAAKSDAPLVENEVETVRLPVPVRVVVRPGAICKFGIVFNPVPVVSVTVDATVSHIDISRTNVRANCIHIKSSDSGVPINAFPKVMLGRVYVPASNRYTVPAAPNSDTVAAIPPDSVTCAPAANCTKQNIHKTD